MSSPRIDQAIVRIEAALSRIEGARASGSRADSQANSARVMALVNNHEKLREEVADTLNDLDAVIAELEDN